MSVRRVKTYIAQTGYVYEYYFVGKRDALANDQFAPSTEFIFDVSSDRKTIFAVSVFLFPRALAAFAETRGRTLSEAEQYAAAKRCLQKGFDEVTNMLVDGRRLALDSDLLRDLLQSVGID
jgi:hypothetical protein